MPELPEVETIARELADNGLTGVPICDVHVRWPRTVLPHDPSTFTEILRGCEVSKIWRRAKYILMEVQNSGEAVGYLITHLRMTGQYSFQKMIPECKHTHVIFELQDGRYLCFKDTRKFGRISFEESLDKLEDKLGLEPFSEDFSAAWLRRALSRSQRQMKPLLLDQSVIAGLGNIYVDEALWDAKIHPLCKASKVSRQKCEVLHESIRKVLNLGLANLGTSLGTGAANYYSVSGRSGRNQDQLKVFRREGLPCPRCQTTIEKMVVGQRGTHVCPRCQKAR